MGNDLSYRVFTNFCYKSLKFSKKENQKKSYRINELASSLLLLIYIFFLYSNISGQRSNSISPENTQRHTNNAVRYSVVCNVASCFDVSVVALSR